MLALKKHTLCFACSLLGNYLAVTCPMNVLLMFQHFSVNICKAGRNSMKELCGVGKRIQANIRKSSCNVIDTVT